MIYIIVSIHVYTCHLFFAISQQWGFLNLTEVTVSIFPARSSNLGFNSGHGPFGRSGPSRASCWYRHEATSLGFDFKLLKNIVDVTPSIFKHELFSMIFSPFISNVTQYNKTSDVFLFCSVSKRFLGCLANKKCGSWNPRTETDRKQLRSRVGSHSSCPSSTCTQGQQHRMEAVFSCRTLRASGKCACLSLVQSWWALNENASQSPWCLESNVSWLWCQLKIWTLDSLLQPLGAKNLKRQEVALLCWPAVGRICRLDAVSKWEGESHPSPQKVSRPHRELHCTFPFAVDKMHWKKIEKWDFQIICIAGRQVFWTCLEGEASSKPGFKIKEVHGTTFPQRFAVPFVGLVVKSA